MKAFLTISCAVVATITTANATMTSKQMSSLRNAARGTAEAAAQYRECNILPTRAKLKIMQMADDVCGASQSQSDAISSYYDSVYNSHRNQLQSQGYVCLWSQDEAHKNFVRMIRGLEGIIDADSCD